jgi:ATP-dependent RNA helicase DeaD
MEKKPFAELGLPPELLKAVDKMGFEEASPIQSAAIPVLLTGVDVVGQSQTGSGKTAAFALPAIERVDVTVRAPQVIVLCPTRELAVQVAEEVSKLSAFKKGVREVPIYGGQSYERQLRGLQTGAQIVIGTPGRVIDMMERKALRLEAVRMVVLDEADRMLDMGFREDIEHILGATPSGRQTVFFAATLPPPIRQLIQRFSKDPRFIKIEEQTLTAPAIDQCYYEVDRRSKIEVLARLIDLNDFSYGLIFCATKMMVDELTEQLLARGYTVDKLHGDMSQPMRERVLGRFRKRAIEFLIATDVAARGIDIDDLEVVFNYDLPQDGEDYIHRIGRTGRAGKSGRAISFVAGREIYKLQSILRYAKGRIRRERVPSLEEVEEKRSNLFFEKLKDTLEQGEYRRHDDLIDRLLEQGHTPTNIASALIHLLNPDKPPSEPERAPHREPRDDRPSRSDERTPVSERGRARAPRTKRDEGPPMTTIVLNVGREHRIAVGDVLGVVAGGAGLPREAVGYIKLMDDHTFVDVATEALEHVLSSLDGIKFKGRKLRISEA